MTHKLSIEPTGKGNGVRLKVDEYDLSNYVTECFLQIKTDSLGLQTKLVLDMEFPPGDINVNLPIDGLSFNGTLLKFMESLGWTPPND